MSILVDAIKRVFFARSGSQVRVKVLKAMAPPLTDGDAATAVIGPIEIVRVCASLFHPSPYPKFAGFGHAVSFVEARIALPYPTSAAKRSSAYVGASRYGVFSALAKASPHRIAGIGNMDALDNCKATKLLTLDVEKWRHSFLLGMNNPEQWDKVS